MYVFYLSASHERLFPNVNPSCTWKEFIGSWFSLVIPEPKCLDTSNNLPSVLQMKFSKLKSMFGCNHLCNFDWDCLRKILSYFPWSILRFSSTNPSVIRWDVKDVTHVGIETFVSNVIHKSCLPKPTALVLKWLR